jgi:osmotically-inducible protein OsmY
MARERGTTDLDLQRDVQDELKWEPSVNAAHLGVAAMDGIVTLSGHVVSFAERYIAERAVKRVSGVRAVVNEIEVKPPGAAQRTDEDIAHAAADAIRSNVLVPVDRVQITVSKGVIKLEGDVDWQFQKTAAERAVRYLPGLLGLADHIVVKPVVRASDVKAKIEKAL